MTIHRIIRILEETNASFILILCHQNADPDALCSAYAFQGLLKHFLPSAVVEIGSGQGISKLSKYILDHLPIAVESNPLVENAEVIVLMDTNTVQQLGQLAEAVAHSSAPIIVIDHHAPHPDTLKRAKLCVVNESAASNCEIVYDFFKQAEIRPDANEAKALFLGIAFDTRHFVLANASTLKTIAELCDLGVEPKESLSLLALPMDLSERLARLKACKRVKLVKLGNWVIAFSHVSSFQSSAARALVDLGAHAAAVAGQRNGNVEISFRCSREFLKETNIHLGKDIAKPLGELLQGMGGGHAAAAGANGIGDARTGLEHSLRLFKKKLAKNE